MTHINSLLEEGFLNGLTCYKQLQFQLLTLNLSFHEWSLSNFTVITGSLYQLELQRNEEVLALQCVEVLT